MRITRREFGRLSTLGGIGWLGEVPQTTEHSTSPLKAQSVSQPEVPEENEAVRVAIIKSSDREEGIARTMALLDERGKTDFSGKDVYLKGSYSSPDPFPATTHPGMLAAAVRLLHGRGTRSITLIERSDMGRTREVLEKLGALNLLNELKVTFRPLDELAADEWHLVELSDSHWPKGIAIPYFIRQDTCVVQLCNLKTHRFGREFSASLENSIGLVAKYINAAERKNQGNQNNSETEKNLLHGRNYMMDLHNSSTQGEMIAEVNQVYTPSVIMMDATEVFISGGPEKGVLAQPEIIAASHDRVALDAVGLAILQYAGARTGDSISVFEQPQIRRAVELRLGANSPEEIEIVSDDNAGRLLAMRLESILQK